MSKAILVTDMPGKCGDCEFCRAYGSCSYMCRLTGNFVDASRKDYCPLKPLPEKMKTGGIYKGGWNDCLSEIGGDCDD